MIAAIDVAYGARGAHAACVLFHAFGDASPASHHVVHVAEVAEYEPGSFYKRELPCVLAALARAPAPPEIVVIDGFVWLSADGRPGLGAKLHEALGGGATVVGVAKTSFAGSAFAEQVLRGRSAKPLFVTAAGVDPQAAAGWIQGMHGPHRIPTLLGMADRLCRDAAR
jgi:deoxyribonuclease V